MDPKEKKTDINISSIDDVTLATRRKTPALGRDFHTDSSMNRYEKSEEAEGEAGESAPINLQKRAYDLDPTRFGDWELNGRCVDF